MTWQALERPVWESLTTRHAQFTVGSDKALRFSSDISPFASPKDDSPECFEALAQVIPKGGYVVMLQVPKFEISSSFDVLDTGIGVQLVPDNLTCDTVDTKGLEPLGEEDGAEMLALAELTKPGPFKAKTHRLGSFWGVKQDGRLVAMAGERFNQPGFTEISGVCTHPDFQGHGYGRKVSAAIAQQILKRGDVPYLHTFADNDSAIRLYESLGFRVLRNVHAAVLKRAGEPLSEAPLFH
jgi:ribosomal protein S18 acetylase RimI-like enzyme